MSLYYSRLNQARQIAYLGCWTRASARRYRHCIVGRSMDWGEDMASKLFTFQDLTDVAPAK